MGLIPDRMVIRPSETFIKGDHSNEYGSYILDTYAFMASIQCCATLGSTWPLLGMGRKRIFVHPISIVRVAGIWSPSQVNAIFFKKRASGSSQTTANSCEVNLYEGI